MGGQTLRAAYVTRPLDFLLPAILIVGSGFVLAAPGVEERNAGNAGAVAPSTDQSIAVFEQFQQFQSEIETLTGRVEQLEHALGQARDQDRARYLDLDARIKALELAAQKPAAEAGAATVPAAAAAAGTALPAATDDEKALFDRALALVREKKYDAAIDQFEQQLKLFPRGELAPTAMYWLGEMWLVASVPDAPKAGRYFYRVYNEYPKSTRASAAMYRHGLLQCQGDELAKGRVTLNKVIIQYSASQDAKLAEMALQQQCK